MPEEAKSPVYMRVAEGAYGAMFSATKRSEILEAMEQWADDELFIIAHLSYLKLQALEAVRLQNERIIALLEDIKADTDELAAVAEELGGEDFEYDLEVSDEDEPAEPEIVEPEVIELPQSRSGRKAELLGHPEPEEPDGEESEDGGAA